MLNFLENYSYEVWLIFSYKTSNPSCIDLTLANCAYSFQSTFASKAVLSDFHLRNVAVIKASFERQRPKYINYENYNTFLINRYVEDLELSKGKRQCSS